MKARILACVLLGLGVGVACKPKPNRVPPLCKYDVASDNELASKTLPAGTWLALASPSVDRQTMTRKGPLKDSCGRVVQDPATDETMACPAARFETQPVAGDALEEKDLLVAQVDANKVVLWAATDEFVDGQAVGPVSLALWTEDGIEIHAAGVLRGFRTGARVRMHHASGIPVLVLESDRCTPDGKCTRVGQFVPVLARRFREVPVHETGRGCIGRPQFALTRDQEIAIDDKWVRRFRLVRNIELVDGGIMLNDLVTVDEFDKTDPAAPPTPFRRATASRPLELVDGHFELRDEDLWERVLRDDGSARGPLRDRK